MFSIDMALIEIVNNSIQLTDLWSTSFNMPVTDTIQSLTLINSTISSSSMELNFSRPLVTGDT